MSRVLDLWAGMTGTVLDFAGNDAPDGWLMCFGQSLVRSDYPNLFAKIGTTYGAVDATQFNLPDLRGRVIAGVDNMGGQAASRLVSAVTGQTLGAAGGAEAHTLTTGQMPAHNHAVTDPTHTHSVYDPTHTHTDQTWTPNVIDQTGGIYPVGADANGSAGVNMTTNASATGISLYAAATGISTQNNGNGAAHNNTQPTIVLNKIIKA